eukprot:GHVU01180842.1.p2 GENE.GHVU01180842.1~~GHVU01180842.1.p2  ORF type:complete len:241 (+),score=53.24 GHVU01180842.1:579-1301(+)
MGVNREGTQVVWTSGDCIAVAPVESTGEDDAHSGGMGGGATEAEESGSRRGIGNHRSETPPESPLLRRRRWVAHGGSLVTAIARSHACEEFIVSGGEDRTYRIWQLEKSGGSPGRQQQLLMHWGQLDPSSDLSAIVSLAWAPAAGHCLTLAVSTRNACRVVFLTPNSAQQQAALDFNVAARSLGGGVAKWESTTTDDSSPVGGGAEGDEERLSGGASASASQRASRVDDLLCTPDGRAGG